MARFKPWMPAQGVVAADDAYICITDPETFVPAASPMQRVGPADVARAARTARDCGATRLVLVSPLSALLQMNAASHTLSSAAEVEIAGMGFETLLVIRPTVDAAHAAGGWLPGLIRTFTRMVLEIILPQRLQALRVRTVATAILQAVERAGPGIHVPAPPNSPPSSRKRCRARCRERCACAESCGWLSSSPCLNEERAIADTLARLAPLRARGAMVVAVDGGSTDRTVEHARAAADHVLLAPRGRALQMNAGARHALADPAVDTLLFLHADTRLPDDADREVRAACAGRPSAWGRFDVRIEAASPALRLVAAMMNLRSRATGICTGDQCLFVTRALFERSTALPDFR